MPAEQMVEESIANRKGGLKRFVWIVGGVVLIILVLLVSFYWLFQSLVRDKVERRLSKFCEGRVEVETVKADFSGQLYLEGIKFYDIAKRPWLSIEKARATLTEWPSRKPVVTEVVVDELNLQILSDEEKLALPFVIPPRPKAGSGRKSGLNKLIIEKAAITIIDAQDSKTAYDNLKLSAVKRDDFYEFILNREVTEGSETFQAEGAINPLNRGFNVSLQMKHLFTKTEMSLPLAALKIKDVSAEGKIATDFKITGSLDELSGLQSNGNIELDQIILYFKDRKLTQDLVARVQLGGQNIKCDEFSATACSGLINGSVYINASQNQPKEFSGKVLARKLNFMELSSIVGGPGRKATKGSVSFNYNFAGEGGNLQGLIGNGQIFLDDADLTVFPAIPHIFKALGLAKLEPLKVSDAESTFSIVGPSMKIQSAHIANRFGAVVAEPGGTINLQTGNVDMYVMAVPLRQLDILARRVPLADIVLNLKDKLSRFHVKGHWSSPPAKLITKTPIKDIKEGTIGFLQDVSRNGGQFGQGILKGLKVLVPVKKSKSN